MLNSDEIFIGRSMKCKQDEAFLYHHEDETVKNIPVHFV